ncbi:MAG: cytochrome c family protein [Alphaproteobacteria bacterium]|nr:cytochrome c family protein [Alphaproteobacteria bacterium]
MAAAAPAAGDVEKGRQSYAKCRACHTLEKGGRNLVGPNLHGMFDRKAGAAAGFSFSPAMRDSGLVWTEENVRRYLRAPKDVVPNTKMIFAGIRSDTEMNDLIAYLRAQTK